MIELTEEQIEQAMLRIEKGLGQYLELQEQLENTDVSLNRDFQRRFNHFYRVRRNSEWQNHFYTLMQAHKDKAVSFGYILGELHKKTGRHEASFASKLIASLNPSLPVIDKYVLQNLGLRIPPSGSPNRAEKIMEIYESLEQDMNTFISTDTGRLIIRKFNEYFPLVNISDMKKVDLVLWQTR